MKSLNSNGPDIFNGFYQETFSFFKKISNNNSLEWIRKNKSDFDKYVLNPAKLLVKDIGPFVSFIDSSIRTEPKIDKTIMRIYKDIRFHPNKPLREFLLIHFGRFKMDSEFYVYLNSENFEIGVFLNTTVKSYLKDNLRKYSNEINNSLDKKKLKKAEIYNFKKSIELIKKDFNPDHDLDLILKNEMLLISISYKLSLKAIYSKKISIEILKHFINFYPLLLFSYYKEPLSKLAQFNEKISK